MPVQKVKILLKQKTAAQWETENPILWKGEPGYEVDTGRLKIGNGNSVWNHLPYFRPEQDTEIALLEHIQSDNPHWVYDDGPSLALLYENKKV
jgi:hypothetical protein